jgi:hypothetical protein
MRLITAIFALLVLAACTHTPPPPPMVWVRMDGQRIADNPTLARQGESDKATCGGNAQAAPSSTLVETNLTDQTMASMDSMKDCMAQKGYLLVPADQAELVREQHAATSAQLQPALPPTPPPHATAKPRPKPKPRPHPPRQFPQPVRQPSQTEQRQPSQAPPWPSPEPPQQPPASPPPK